MRFSRRIVGLQCGLSCELLFADNLTAVTDTEEEMQRRWLGLQIGMESKGLNVNTGKTEVMVSSRRGTKANIKDSQGTSLRQVKTQIFRCHHQGRRRFRGSSKSKS